VAQLWRGKLSAIVAKHSRVDANRVIASSPKHLLSFAYGDDESTRAE
jgi:hypothetical protein